MAGIPTGNILQPGNISVVGGVTRALVSFLQLLTPQYYKTYVEKYGNEDWTWFLATYGGMEIVNNRDYFWFENRGKLMEALGVQTNVAAAAGATITLVLSVADHFNAGTQTPLRVGESFRVASTNVEGVILAITDTTPNAFQFTVRPKRADQALASAGSTSFLNTDMLCLAGFVDVGEASDSNAPMINLDQKYTNSVTEMRETWQATDLAEMTEVFYDNGVSGSALNGAGQAGTSYFTLKGLYKSNTAFINHVEDKLMRGDLVTNTGLPTTTSVGTQGFIPKILVDGEIVGYTGGTLDIAKLHEITRIMDVNGCAKQNMWLMDIFQRQNFSDGIFKEFPAGAFVWGNGEKSSEASIAYGFQSCYIDEYLFQAKKYKSFNTEARTGKTPQNDFFRNFGIICPQGTTPDAKDSTKIYKNIQVMTQAPPKGGSIGNNIRVWPHGGGSQNPTDGKMVDFVETITYRGLRVVAANQFITVQAA